MNNTISEIKIREKQQKDMAELRTLFLEVRQQTFLWRDTSVFTLLNFDKETEEEYILVALAENKVVGFISVWLADNFIHHLYVDNTYHNLGIGTQLLDTIINKVGLPVGLKCIEKNRTAMAFYTKRGFTEKVRGLSDNEVYIFLELRQ
ncbi:GNAT family N-acetyltransferase [Cytophagaceae bacterium DM2B3-1]|uniref:GNAT family N-acetyltransferase n=1 Tax=Xanthocytophaga flava TaxID=3048013 RepID=A0ABT7CNN1_9BACT|nr:GNAT family N-acetyltransferase [Xanthocytophaga flavus]MDJ1495332.1 GNAT family N-acetyltransferase [Xanthocytophaga flavus]